MIKELTEKLMWERIDGTISAADDARLEAMMKRDAEARECFQELKRLSALLATCEELDPPPELRERIEAAIDFGRPAGRPEGRSFWRSLMPVRWDLRVVAAAAAGLAIGIAGYHVFVYGPASEGLLDRSRLVGTIAPVKDGLEIDLQGVRGRVAFRENEALAISVVDVRSEREIDMVLEYSMPSVRVEASSGALGDVSVSGNTVALKSVGEGRYVAAFRQGEPGSPLRVRIVSEGDLLLDEEVRPAGAR